MKLEEQKVLVNTVCFSMSMTKPFGFKLETSEESKRGFYHTTIILEVLTVSHFVELNVFLNVLCKLDCVPCFSNTQQQNLLT